MTSDDYILSEIRQPQKGKYCVTPLTGVPKKSSKSEIESRMMNARVWGEGEMESYYLMDIEF